MNLMKALTRMQEGIKLQFLEEALTRIKKRSEYITFESHVGHLRSIFESKLHATYGNSVKVVKFD